MKKLFLMVTTIILLTACQESLEERAAREAREVTEAKCPMPIGNNMYMDSVVTTLENTNVKETLVQELKNTPNYKALMQRGVSFRYVYRSTKNPEKTYLDITIVKEDYQ